MTLGINTLLLIFLTKMSCFLTNLSDYTMVLRFIMRMKKSGGGGGEHENVLFIDVKRE